MELVYLLGGALVAAVSAAFYFFKDGKASKQRAEQMEDALQKTVRAATKRSQQYRAQLDAEQAASDKATDEAIAAALKARPMDTPLTPEEALRIANRARRQLEAQAKKSK